MVVLGERFWNKVQRGEGCWLWTASTGRGYGVFSVDGRLVGAHRLAYADRHGVEVAQVPLLDHACHNKTECAGGEQCVHRRCVRPDHLVQSSHRANLLSSPLTLAAQNAAKTHCPAGHEYTAENTYRTKGRGLRMCRTCARDRARSRRAAARN